MGVVDETFSAIIAIIIVAIFFFSVLPAIVSVTGFFPAALMYLLGIFLILAIVISIFKIILR